MPAWAVSIAKYGAASVGLGLIFAWFGIYNTGLIPIPQRIVYWIGLMALGVTAGTIITPLVSNRWIPDAHPALQIGLASLLISVPITLGLTVLAYLSEGSVVRLEWWALQYVYVLVVTLILTTGAWAAETLAERKSATPATSAASPFSDRLPVKFRAGTVYAVSAEDHYLRVHTSLGETMVLMRLADAVRELASLEGMQTHRSWWVAKQGLADASRGDGKVTLTLKSGGEAPVSRTYLKAVKDAGWL